MKIDTDSKRIIKICKKLIKILNKEKALEIDQAVNVIGQVFSIKFILNPWDLRGMGKFGLSKVGKKGDIFIFFEKTTTKNHANLIIFHEVGHWILKHNDRRITNELAEQQAELFAIEMLTRFVILQTYNPHNEDTLIRSLTGGTY